MDNRKKAIEQYLSTHFAGAETETVRSASDDAFLCRIRDTDGEVYEMIVTDEALSGELDDMLAQLERYNPAQVLRDVLGFPIHVTVNGCIVGS